MELENSGARKRKCKGSSGNAPDTTTPVSAVIVVPAGMLSDRISQVGRVSANLMEILRHPKSRELLLSRKRDRWRLRMAAPAGRNENPMFELSGFGATRDSSRIT